MTKDSPSTPRARRRNGRTGSNPAQRTIGALLDQLAKRDQRISWSGAELRRLARKVREYEDLLLEKERDAQALAAQLTAQLAEKDQSLHALSGQLTEKEQSLQAFSYRLREREQFLQALSGQIEEKDNNLKALTIRIAEHEQSAQALAARLEQTEQTVRTLSDRLAERDRSLQDAADRLAKRDRTLQETADRLAETEQSAQTLSTRLSEKERELTDVQSSNLWKIALLQLRIVDALAPRGGFRRAVLKKVFRSILLPVWRLLQRRPDSAQP